MKKIHHSSEKYIFRHLVSVHLIPLCVTLAADLLRFLITKRKEESFYYLQAELLEASITFHGRLHHHLVPSPMHHQLNGQLSANLIVHPSPWMLTTGKGEEGCPSSEEGLKTLPKASLFTRVTVVPANLPIGTLTTQEKGQSD